MNKSIINYTQTIDDPLLNHVTVKKIFHTNN